MSGSNLFKFDDNFDPNVVETQRAMEKEAVSAGMTEEEARAYARQGGGGIVMGASDEEVETIRQEAFQQGLNQGTQQGLDQGMQQGTAAGIEQMRNEAEVLAAQSLQSMGQHISELHAGYQQELQNLRAEAVSIGMHVARRLAPGLIAKDPVPEIESMIAEVLADIGEKPEVSIKVAPAVAPLIEEKIQGLKFETRFEGDIEVVADPTIPPTDCRLDWAKGGAERSFARMLWEVEKSVSRYLGTDLPDSDTALASMRHEMEDGLEEMKQEVAALEAQKEALQAEIDAAREAANAAPAPETNFDESELLADPTANPVATDAPHDALDTMAMDQSAAGEETASEAEIPDPDLPSSDNSFMLGEDAASFDIFTPGDIDQVDAEAEGPGSGLGFADITLSKAKQKKPPQE